MEICGNDLNLLGVLSRVMKMSSRMTEVLMNFSPKRAERVLRLDEDLMLEMEVIKTGVECCN